VPTDLLIQPLLDLALGRDRNRPRYGELRIEAEAPLQVGLLDASSKTLQASVTSDPAVSL
jgi:hypothetical protein